MNKEIKPVIIVDAFFHNDICLKTFTKYLSFIKKLDIPIMLVTNSDFDHSLLKEVDCLLYDNKNRLFKKEYPDTDVIFIWYGDNYKYFSIQNNALQKHGLSVLSNLKHSTTLAQSLGYTHFFRIEYDCFIDNIETVHSIIKQTEEANKKGYIYLNEGRFISFQVWYFELDYFNSVFPIVNTEEDYIEIKKQFGSHENRFMLAEEFVYNLIKNTSDQLIIKEAKQMFIEFPSSYWNTIISPSESDSIVDGFSSAIHRVGYTSDWSVQQFAPVDKNKFSIVTWNCSSSLPNKSIITIKRFDSEPQVIEHEIEGDNGHKIDIFDLSDTDIEIEICMNNKNPKSYIVNKNNIHTFGNMLSIKE